MQGSSSVRRDVLGDRTLAQKILVERDALRECMLEVTAPLDERTILLDILAECAIDRVAESVEDASWKPLLAWAEEICDERAHAPSVVRLFTSLSPVLAQALGHDGFDDLAGRLAALVQKPHPNGDAIYTERVNELDVLLADMVARVESADPMTAEHCRAVSAWCARIAQRMSLTRTEVTHVSRGGLIHDVGKSTTPLEILQAPRKLTDEEWTVMRAHVVTGHALIAEHPKLGDFGGIVRSHHERFDGAGYPDALDRSRIPIGVRIVTVADAFNAMIGRRLYRTPLAPDRAVAELKRHAGAQFDPNVVEAFIDVISNGRDAAPVAGEAK